MVARENYKKCALGRAGILACTIACAKKVAVSESREIIRVAYLGQKLILEAVACKNYERSACERAGMLACAIRPNNEYWKQSCAKIIKGALPRGPGY